MSENKGTRINKFLSEAGFCSRREADKLIEKNRVKINGKVPLVGTKVIPGDRVSVDKKIINSNKEKLVYIAFNKPKGNSMHYRHKKRKKQHHRFYKLS